MNVWGRQIVATARTSLFSWSFLPQPVAFFQQWRGKNTLKTNRSMAKRFRVRGDGSLKRNKAGKSHNTGYKTRARTNRLGQSTTIQDPKMHHKMKRCLGVS